MFVRPKKVNGNTYYQLVRSFREDGKVKQQFLCHLGRHKSREAAIAAERELAERHEREAAYWSEEAKDTKDVCLEEYAEEIGGDFPSRKQAHLRWRAFSKEYNESHRSPYYGWLTSVAGWVTAQHELIEWNQSWEKRVEIERDLIGLVYEHHDDQDEARRHNKWAATHRTQLNKFLECKRKYF
jgi:hypothetical protein